MRCKGKDSPLLEKMLLTHLSGACQSFSGSFPAAVISKPVSCPLPHLPHSRFLLPISSLWLHMPCCSVPAQAFNSVKMTAILLVFDLVSGLPVCFSVLSPCFSQEAPTANTEAYRFSLAPQTQTRCRFQTAHLAFICLISASSSGDTG